MLVPSLLSRTAGGADMPSLSHADRLASHRSLRRQPTENTAKVPLLMVAAGLPKSAIARSVRFRSNDYEWPRESATPPITPATIAMHARMPLRRVPSRM